MSKPFDEKVANEIGDKLRAVFDEYKEAYGVDLLFLVHNEDSYVTDTTFCLPCQIAMLMQHCSELDIKHVGDHVDMPVMPERIM